jgi:acetyl esterase/lipase
LLKNATNRVGSFTLSKATPTHIAIVPGRGVKGCWVDPVPNLIFGEILDFARVAGVTAVRIPGYWMEKSALDIPIGAHPSPGEKVIYCLHGGGYALCSAHPDDPSAEIARGLLQYCPSVLRTFSIEYRLSVGQPYTPQNPFPAALVDALAGYNYLVNVVGFMPTDIIIEGDSAGGNLALALTRYLVENQHADVKLPAPPSALILLSPWTDLSYSHYTPGSSCLTFGPSDHLLDLRTGVCKYFHHAFLGVHGVAAAERSRYISPACLRPCMEEVSFTGFPRTFISAGGCERMLDQIKTLWRMMALSMEGEGQIVYDESPDSVHDFITMPFHEPQRGDTLRKIATWLEFPLD